MPRLRGAVSSDGVKAALKKLLPGQRLLAFFEGADDVWHEYIAGWPVSIEKGVWAITTSDGDGYIMVLSSGGDATHLCVLPSGGARPTGLHYDIYGFSNAVLDGALASSLVACRSLALEAREAGEVVHEPRSYMDWSGVVHSGRDLPHRSRTSIG